jgi:hypothetical protein
MSMEFVKVMEIKARYAKTIFTQKPTPAGSVPKWYMRAFVNENPTTEDFETARRELLAWAEQHPERPAYTPEQVKVMRAAAELGFTHVAKNRDGSVIATVGEPYNLASENYEWHAMDEDELGCEVITTANKLQRLAPAIPDWTVPLDLLAALKDAGEEV